MHPALKKLIDANVALERAEAALTKAQQQRRQCALDLRDIEDEEERLTAAIFAYSAFGKGLSLVLAEAVTGLPGKKGQSQFLVLAGRKQHQPKGYGRDAIRIETEPMVEWPSPTVFEREVIASHIRHGRPFQLDEGLGWTNLRASLQPCEAEAFLDDPTSALATHFGVSRGDFVLWLSTWGHVGCEARYGNGNPCTARVAGVPGMLPIEKWKDVKSKGGYCKRHGGKPS
jgi:hypothetical protein